MERPMWTCPDCGRQFHNVNNAHSCTARIGVKDHLAGRPPGVSEAYRRFEAMVREIGPITVEPLKSRIAYGAGAADRRHPAVAGGGVSARHRGSREGRLP